MHDDFELPRWPLLVVVVCKIMNERTRIDTVQYGRYYLPCCRMSAQQKIPTIQPWPEGTCSVVCRVPKRSLLNLIRKLRCPTNNKWNETGQTRWRRSREKRQTECHIDTIPPRERVLHCTRISLSLFLFFHFVPISRFPISHELWSYHRKCTIPDFALG